MSKGAKIVIAVLGCFFVFIIVGVVALFWALGDVAKAESYEMSGDVIPSLGKVVGHRKVGGYSTESSSGLSKKAITYSTDNSQKDVASYVAHLVNEEKFLFLADYDPDQPTGHVRLVKRSRDEGMLVLLEIEYSLGTCVVALTKGKGEVTVKSADDDGAERSDKL